MERNLHSSEYNRRTRECQEALEVISRKQKTLKKLSQLQEDNLRDFQGIPRILYKRARHVVEENNRVKKAVEALKTRSWKELGEILNQSHFSLRDLFQVSTQELDFLIEKANNLKGCLGARLTGAGFGGCTINLVVTTHLKNFCNKLGEEYNNSLKTKPYFYTTLPAEGAYFSNN